MIVPSLIIGYLLGIFDKSFDGTKRWCKEGRMKKANFDKEGNINTICIVSAWNHAEEKSEK